MMTAQQEPGVATGGRLDPAGRSFIEVQFPVSKLSKESYKERKANSAQTLTALGKWWGRKPLILVRAVILGLLLPATENTSADREVFLSLMGMDDEGLLKRMGDTLAARDVYSECTPRERESYFDSADGRLRWKSGTSSEDKKHLQRRAFLRMGYDRRLEHCKYPEDSGGPSDETWKRINTHLGTSAKTISDLVVQLGGIRFGHVPRVGDACSGGGSIPFEAARIGCEAYASDLSPVAALLTWGALNIVGGGDNGVKRVREAQEQVYKRLREQIDAWGIETNEDGWVADAFLYCNEIADPVTGWLVPVAPSWVIGAGTHTIARLNPNPAMKRFDMEIVTGVSPAELEQARAEGTWNDGIVCPVDRDGRWLPPSQRQLVSAEQLRGRQGLRLWEHDDFVARPGDVFQERLYCIRWVDPKTGKRRYSAPTSSDLAREARVLHLLRERIHDWQKDGLVPDRRIVVGTAINRPTRARGWAYWHHLFNPRQLLMGGLFAQLANDVQSDTVTSAGLLLATGRVADWNSRLSRWDSHGANEKGAQTFYNPTLNTPPVAYCCRASSALRTTIMADLAGVASRENGSGHAASHVVLSDARIIDHRADLWVTDPGYADKVVYEELSEFFLAWYDKRLSRLFPGWYSDSKRALAVSGKGEVFRVAMSECYKRLAMQMPDNGFQVVMFTHQDPEVWADVALVLWAAGLQVSAAWTIATETGATGVKEGNFVQGTVVLVLRKRLGDVRGGMADLYPDIQAEVREQLESMLALDPKDDPNFGDADYQLAAYAAALRVMTGYSAIDEIDIERELRRTRAKGEKSPVTGLIERAVRIASDILVPDGLDASVWRRLGPEERLYLKGIQIEARGESREGVYQELARGYGAAEYREMLASRAANKARLKTPGEFAARDVRGLASGGFAGSLLRQVLFAVYTTAMTVDGGPRAAREYLRRELPDYWNSRETIVAMLRFLVATPVGLEHWEADAKAAQLLLGSIENDTM